MADIEKVIKGLKIHEKKRVGVGCLECPYAEAEGGTDDWCIRGLHRDILDLLNAQRWIPVSERLPEEKETIFAKLKGTDKWRSAMFEKMSDDVRVVVIFADGTRRVSHSHTIDGKWECEKHPLKRTVTHWMQNPELPKEGDGE